MDANRFDAWTRRRIALATGGALAASLGFSAVDGANASKRKRKRRKRNRCVKLLRPCHTGGRKCCRHHVCQSFNAGANGTFFCCKGQGQSCTTSDQCCPPSQCERLTGSDAGTCAFL